MARLRFVVVGCGSIGRRHARLLSDRSDVALEICDIDADNLDRVVSEAGQVTTHSDFEAMLETRPDAVLIATPTGHHAAQTMAALASGAHVLCEKPMTDSLESARRVLAAARRSDRLLGIGFTLHFHPAMRRIREAIDSDRLGRILHVHWHVGSYITLMNSTSRYQARLEGALALDYAHQPDLIQWWLGDRPTAVFAAGVQGGDLELQSNPNVMALTIEYEASTVATIHLNYVQHPDRCSCEVVGDRGWISFDFHSGCFIQGDRATEARTQIEILPERDALYLAEHQCFLDAVSGAAAAESPPEEAIISMAVIEAALASWKKRQRVTVPPFD